MDKQEFVNNWKEKHGVPIKKVPTKSYTCLACKLDFSEEDRLTKNKSAKCPRCKKGKFVVRSNNPVSKVKLDHA